ncbi:NAD-dependent epimerase/dehydratase family protein [Caenimonas terrae]|uniref:NAD-dependent epimerase/dehydratase family protein n=1 Tax=Caenimonas terrae TaxID=696074 RepID=A0ABW0NDL6_9BURK
MAALPPLADPQGSVALGGLKGQSIFVTGGTGFLGSWLVESLLQQNRIHALGLRVTVLSRNPAAFSAAYPDLAQDAALTLHQGDIASFEFPAGRFGLAVHAALPVASATPDLVETARLGARRMADFVRHAGVGRLLHVSSGAVYGPHPPGVERLAEDTAWDTAAAANDYTLAKRAEEQVFADAVDGCITARCFALIGPRQSPDSGTASAQFIDRAANGLGIRIEGDGQAVRSYQYASDTAAWLVALLARGRPDRAYNVGSEEALSIAALAQKVRAIAGGPPVEVLGRAAPGRAGARYVPDTARARQELGLANQVGLDEAIARTLRWRQGCPLPSPHE